MTNSSATGGYLSPAGAQPPDDDALDDILQAAIVGITGLDGTLVRPRWQLTNPKHPEPTVNWCAFGIMSIDPDANAFVEHDPDASGGLGQDDLSRNEEFRVLASFYGPNHAGYAKLLRDGLSVPQNREALMSSLIAFVDTATIRTVPALLNEQWVRGSDLPIRFRRLEARSFAVLNIESATVDVIDDVGTEIINVG